MGKGQVTLFLIIGVLAILFIGIPLFFVSESRLLETRTTAPAEFRSNLNARFNSAVIKCMEALSGEIVIEEGYDSGLIKSHIQDNIESCIPYGEFEKQGYNISKGTPIVSAENAEEELLISLEYPITIEKDNAKYLFKEFFINYKKLERIPFSPSVTTSSIFFNGMLSVNINGSTKIVTLKNEQFAGIFASIDNDVPRTANIIGPVYMFNPNDAYFDPPLKITMLYDEDSAGADESSLRIFTFDPYSGEWALVPSYANPEENTVTGMIRHFSGVAIGKNMCIPNGFDYENCGPIEKVILANNPGTGNVLPAEFGDYDVYLQYRLKPDTGLATLWENCVMDNGAGVDLDEFVSIQKELGLINKIDDAATLYVGQKLYLPWKSSSLCVNQISKIIERNTPGLECEPHSLEFSSDGVGTFCGCVGYLGDEFIHEVQLPENAKSHDLIIEKEESVIVTMRNNNIYLEHIDAVQNDFFSTGSKEPACFMVTVLPSSGQVAGVGGGEGAAETAAGPIIASMEEVQQMNSVLSQAECGEVPFSFFINKISSPNFEAGKNNRQGVIIHCTQGHSDQLPQNFFSNADGNGKSSHYVLMGDGKIYQLVEESKRAIHVAGNNDKYIGIEVANLCELTEHDGKFFDAYGMEVAKEEVYDYGQDFLGYRYWHKYTGEQLGATHELVNYIASCNGIHATGVVGHYMVQPGKMDPGPEMAKSFGWI